MQSASKRAKTEGETEPEPKLDVIVQTGLYAAEMFASNESFIWVLIWVCLRYENGMLKGTMLNEWLKEDALGCHDKKTYEYGPGLYMYE